MNLLDVGATLPEDPSLKWMLGTLIVILGGLLGYVVKAVVDKIGPGQEKIVVELKDVASAVREVPTAVGRAVREAMRDEHAPR